MNERQFRLLVAAISGFVGSAAGYLVGHLQGEKQVVPTPISHSPEVQAELQAQLDELRARRLKKVVIDEEAKKEAEERHPSTFEIENVSVDEDGVPELVFAGSGEDWDYEKELASRDSAVPYVIHKDEFYDKQEFAHHSVVTLTYYRADNILAEETNEVIYDRAGTIGDNLHRFGQGSGDPRILFIRNETLEIDYEIYYEHGLHNMDEEELDPHSNIQHGTAPRRFKLRE